MQDTTSHWKNKHEQYSQTDWINKPSLFAEFAIQYFPKSGKILELGAGQGQDSRFFAQNGFNVISTDKSSDALELNREKITTDIESSIELLELDMEKTLPFADNSFDVVYSHLSLHYFSVETTKKIFHEIFRILKPSGILAVFVNSIHDPQYGTGTKIENDYFQIEDIKKRFFSKETLASFASEFDVVLTDENGETYKDSAKGIHNLVRMIAKKK